MNIQKSSLNLSPEHQLLLLCCQEFLYKNARPLLQNLISNTPIDWKEAYKLASKQGILSQLCMLLFYKLDGIPPEFIQSLQNTQRYINTRNRQQVNELIRVFKVLQKENIPLLPYKGFAFASQFYHNIFQRISVDIDFALDIKHYKRIQEIMPHLGYEEYKSRIDTDAIANSRAYYLDYPWVRKKDDTILSSVEFHWTPSHQVLNIPIKFHEFMEESTTVKMATHQIPTFKKVPQALFAIIHHGNVDCWGKLKHLVDLGLMLKVLNSNELEELKGLCKKYRIYRSFEIGKSLLQSLFDTTIPSTKIHPSKAWIREIVHGGLHHSHWTESKGKLLFFIQSRDGWWDKIKALGSILHYQFFVKPKLDKI